jgi:putative transposase
LHYKISCIKHTLIHQATSSIINKADIIVLDNVPIKLLVGHYKLALAKQDVSLGEFRRQIEYKARWYGKTVIIADQFFPSSKTCSCCGWKDNDQTLSDRVFNCQQCGLIIDRDLNAAKNLARYGSTAKYVESEACGEGSSVSETVHSPSLKQEVESLINLT